MTPERMGLAARPRHDRIGNHRTDRQDKNREESAEHRPLHPSSDPSDRDPTTDRNARHSSRRPKYTPLGCAGGESHERSFAVATWPPCFSSRLRQRSGMTPEERVIRRSRRQPTSARRTRPQSGSNSADPDRRRARTSRTSCANELRPRPPKSGFQPPRRLTRS
jgi:hypothetical protein